MSGAVCRQVVPPGNVTHCVSAFLTQPRGQGAEGAARLPELVVIRRTVLDVYALSVEPDPEASGKRPDGRLELLEHTRLHGVVEDCAVLKSRLPHQQDALILTFREAKISVVRWDRAKHSLVTTSLHYYEGHEENLEDGRTLFPLPPQVAADPRGRCAVVLLLGFHLALLPAMQLDVYDDVLPSSEAALAAAATVGNSKLLNLSRLALNPRIRQVRAVAFLWGYDRPVLLLLHEDGSKNSTWQALYRTTKDTLALTALSLDILRGRHPKIWSASDLPSDAFAVQAAPVGGALVLCTNYILYYIQGMCSCSIAVNGYSQAGAVPPRLDEQGIVQQPLAAAKNMSEFWNSVHPEATSIAARTAKRIPGLEIELDGCSSAWLGDLCLLVSLRSGQLFVVHLQMQAGRVRDLVPIKKPPAPPASCLCTLGASWLFLGSFVGDSLLLHVAAAPAQQQRRGQAQTGAKSAAAPPLQAGVAQAAAPQADGAGDGAEPPGLREPPPAAAASLPLAPPGMDGAGVAANGSSPAPPGLASDASEAGLPQKRKRLDSGTDLPEIESGMPEASGEDSDGIYDEEELYGTEDASDGKADSRMQYQLSVADTLSGIGPIRDMILPSHFCPEEAEAGAAAASAGGPAEKAGKADGGPDTLVACCGYERTGSVVLIRRGFLPRLITSVPLTGLMGAWALRHSMSGPIRLPTGLEPSADAPVPFHAFLLLMRQDQESKRTLTMVLNCQGEALEEVTNEVDFLTSLPTVHAAGMLGSRLAVQVTTAQVLVLVRGRRSQLWTLEDEVPAARLRPGTRIVQACSTDRFLLLTTSAGFALLLEAHVAELQLRLVDAAAPLLVLESLAQQPGSAVSACCLHSDDSRWLRSQRAGLAAAGSGAADAAADAEDYLVVCRQDGSLAVHALPSMQRVFAMQQHCGLGESLLFDAASPHAGVAAAGPRGEGEEDAAPVVVEVRMESFGSGCLRGRHWPSLQPRARRPLLLLLLSDDTLLLYRAHVTPSRAAEAGGLAWHRLPLNWLSHEIPPFLPNPELSDRGRMVRFDDLGEAQGYSGIVVLGARPLWLVASRGRLVPHALDSWGEAVGMCSFHNASCAFGFILAHNDQLRICQVPREVRLDTPLPLVRHRLKATPHHAAWDAAEQLLAVVVSRQECPVRSYLPQEALAPLPEARHAAQDIHASTSYELASAAARGRMVEEGHDLRLIDPTTWQTVGQHALMPHEKGTAMCSGAIHDYQLGRVRKYVAVGTSIAYGEDYPCIGRIVLYETARPPPQESAQQQPGDAGKGGSTEPHTWLRMAYCRELSGPVLAIDILKPPGKGEGVHPDLVLAVGSEVQILACEDGRLRKVAFFDASLLCSSLVTVRNFLLIGDAHQGVQFVQYREQGRQLIFRAKAVNPLDVTCGQFMFWGGVLLLTAMDRAGTVHMLEYRGPKHPQGSKLAVRAAFHLGTVVTSLLPVSTGPRRQGVAFGSRDGALGHIFPLEPGTTTHARLLGLQRHMALRVSHPAGLNPRAFRQRWRKIHACLGGGRLLLPPRSEPSAATPPARAAPPRPPCEDFALDGDLLMSFPQLSLRQQRAIAAACDQPLEELLADLRELASTLDGIF